MALQTIPEKPVLSFYKGTGTLAKYRFIKLDDNGKVVPVAAATDFPIGVLLETTEKPDIPVPVQVSGVCLAEAGGTVTSGRWIKIDASGKVVDATQLNIKSGATSVTSTAANGNIIGGGYPEERVVGKAIDSGTSGDYVRIVIF